MLALALTVAPAFAHAAEEFDVPATCGSQSEFETEVQARLGGGVTRPPTRVQIARDGEQFLLRMQVGPESRELRDMDCRELFRGAVVVAVAMSLAQSQAEQRSPQTPAASPAPAPENASEPPAREAPPAKAPATKAPLAAEARSAPESKRTASPSSVHFGLSAAAGVNFGMAPVPVLELDVEGRALFGWAGVASRFHYRASGEDTDANRRGVSVSAIGGQAALLLRPLSYVEGSLGFSLDRLAGVGVGAARQLNDVAWAAGPTVGISGIPLHRGGTWLALGSELRVDVLRPEFEILNYGSVFRVPLFSGSIFVRAGHVFF